MIDVLRALPDGRLDLGKSGVGMAEIEANAARDHRAGECFGTGQFGCDARRANRAVVAQIIRVLIRLRQPQRLRRMTSLSPRRKIRSVKMRAQYPRPGLAVPQAGKGGGGGAPPRKLKLSR